MDDLIRRSDVIKVLEECYLDKQLFEKDVYEKDRVWLLLSGG
jgi:hypothetical protein